MENALYYITADEVEKIKSEMPPGIFIGEIDLAKIKSDDDYLNTIGELFRFPMFEGQTGHSWNGFNDWIRDLYWENDKEWMEMTKEGYCLIIHNCEAMKNDTQYSRLYEDIVDNLIHIVLPWWKKDVISSVVEGEPKTFKVYLVI